MTFILASNNPGKLSEMEQILAPLGHTVISQRQAGLNLEAEETGTTFQENALIKARAAYQALHMPALADDSGLMVDALDGAPGVYSARYAGPDSDGCDRLLKELNGVSDRSAKFVCSIACILSDGNTITAYGECRGEITDKRIGSNGFGYDPVFYLPAFGKTMAEMTAEEKNKISHRANALKQFAEKLRQYERKG